MFAKTISLKAEISLLLLSFTLTLIMSYVSSGAYTCTPAYFAWIIVVVNHAVNELIFSKMLDSATNSFIKYSLGLNTTRILLLLLIVVLSFFMFEQNRSIFFSVLLVNYFIFMVWDVFHLHKLSLKLH